MKFRTDWVRPLLGLLLILFQMSVLNVALVSSVTPNLLLSLMIAWTLVLGFDRTWRLAVGLGLMLDIVSAYSVGLSALLLVFGVYAASFVSRRFLMGQRGAGLWLLASLVAFGSVIYKLIFVWLSVWIETGQASLLWTWMEPMLHAAPLQALVNLIAFLVIYAGVARLERRLALSAPVKVARPA